MLSVVARLNLALLLACAAASQAAVIEIENPVPRTSHAPDARLMHWQAMARDIGFMDGAVNSARRAKAVPIPAGVNLLHVANGIVPGAGETGLPLYQDYYWNVGDNKSTSAGRPEESVQNTEVWPMVIIAVGLVAYQLRRLSRTRSGVVRITPGRP